MDYAFLFILAFIIVFLIIFAAAGFKIVQQSETMIIERLGKYNRTLSSGINIILPIFDKLCEIHWMYTVEGRDGSKVIRFKTDRKIDLRETVYDFPKQNVITKDNASTEINALLYFQIVDLVKAIYEIANLPDAIEKLTQTTLRNVLGELELNEALTSRDTINSKLRAILDDATNKWGVKVNRVELQYINPPQDIRESMEKQMRAERERRAKILETEGLKQSEILEAEGQANARIKVAEAETQAIERIKQATNSIKGDPINYLVAIKYIDTLKEMVSGKDNKIIYLPYEATGILSSIGGIKEMLEKGK
ncbi:MAG: SPFH/Band 7/PHB domain protein [Bacteroidetes bacterium]|nr:SPFH/Band 7/PHB domain protein [Bacteroidota bacterium]